MSNKTSDKNVANEERLNNFIEAYKQTKEQSFIVDSINKDFFFEFVDCLLAEQEQKDKRIKELEEEGKENKKKYLTLLLSQFPDTTETYKKYKKELEELLEGEK